MRALLVISLLLPLAFAGEVPESLRELGEVLHAHCVGETSVDPSLIDNAKKGNFSTDKSLKCYLRCLFEETSLITDEGKFDTDGFIGVLTPEMRPTFEPIVKLCVEKTAVGADECETMWMTTKCFYDQDPVVCNPF